MRRHGGFSPTLGRVSARATGEIELLADADRPGGWLLLVDRIRQSYVDLDDPTYLDFEYHQWFADILDLLPAGPLNVTHVGGGAWTLPRYLAAVRPGSSQIVLEPDGVLTDVVRARLPLPKRSGIRVRTAGGREGVAALRAASADVLVLDAFAGGRVPAELTTVEFLTDAARVLRPGALFLANVADCPGDYTRRLVATLRATFADVLVRADPAVIKGRRYGNLALAASGAPLPGAEIARAAAGAMFPQRALYGAELAAFAGTAAPLTDRDPMRSPAPPDAAWRVADL
jgi:spermidine synthase